MSDEKSNGAAVGSTDLLDVGDSIEFKAFGRTIRGPIIEVSRRGYWVKDPVPFAGKFGDTRCPIGKAKLIKTSNDSIQTEERSDDSLK